MIIKKVLGGLQDLLIKGFDDPDTARQPIQQDRNGQQVDVNYINIDTLPAIGKLGEAGFVSIRDYIITYVTNKFNLFQTTIDNITSYKVNSHTYIVTGNNTNSFTLSFNTDGSIIIDLDFNAVLATIDYSKLDFEVLSESIEVFINGLKVPLIGITADDINKTISVDLSRLTTDLVVGDFIEIRYNIKK